MFWKYYYNFYLLYKSYFIIIKVENYKSFYFLYNLFFIIQIFNSNNISKNKIKK